MLEFIKKIFQKEGQEQKQITEVSLGNLEDWVEEKAKPLGEDIRLSTDSIMMKIDEESQRTRFNLEILENAKLQNPNIPFKAKQYMEGNRKAYIRSVNSFLGHMEINNRDYFYLLEFCKKFDELIDELNKGTIRSYTILQEFFSNEAGKIANNLKNFDNVFRELKRVLNDEKIVAVNKLRKLAEELEYRSKQRINADVDFRNAEASLKIAANEKDSVMADIISFNQSDEHNNFLSLKEERKKIEKSFYEAQDAVLQSFAVLDRPLRKYSHVAFEHEELVLDYLKDPIEAMSNDRELMIIKVLENMKQKLEENSMQIDEKKKEKAIDEIKKMSMEFVRDFVKRYRSFMSEIGNIDNKMEATGVNEKFRDFNKRLEEINSRIEKNNEEYISLKEDLAKTDSAVLSLKSEAEGSVRKIFGEEVKISI